MKGCDRAQEDNQGARGTQPNTNPETPLTLFEKRLEARRPGEERGGKGLLLLLRRDQRSCEKYAALEWPLSFFCWPCSTGRVASSPFLIIVHHTCCGLRCLSRTTYRPIERINRNHSCVLKELEGQPVEVHEDERDGCRQRHQQQVVRCPRDGNSDVGLAGGGCCGLVIGRHSLDGRGQDDQRHCEEDDADPQRGHSDGRMVLGVA